MSFLILQQLDRIKCHNHALSMKYSICNIQLLPKAADLRKKAFDEFPLNMAIGLQLLSQNAPECSDYISWLPSSSFLVPRVSLPNCMLGTLQQHTEGVIQKWNHENGIRNQISVIEN